MGEKNTEMQTSQSKPKEIIIVGAGVFGLSTAKALLTRPKYTNSHITIIDAAVELPNTSSASSDTSRILRADYANNSYTKLVSNAQKLWRDVSAEGWGGQGRYHDAKLVFTEQPGTEAHVDGLVEEAFKNVKLLADHGAYEFKPDHIRRLNNKDALMCESRLPGSSGDFGYVNDNCGWVNADACMQFVFERLRASDRGRLKIRSSSRVRHLIYECDSSSDRDICRGVELEDGTRILAELTILAAGAWTPSLVDVEGQAMATGQVLCYLPLNEKEQKALANCPIYFNASRGMFLIPPRNGELKVGRHSFGYQNPAHTRFASGHRKMTDALVSVPRSNVTAPIEGETACREFLKELLPGFANKKFSKTKVCWYCDTPSGDFLVDYHPRYNGLFLATGDSGHGFKVFPVIGDKIVDAIDETLEGEYRDLWQWKKGLPTSFKGTDDGTRGGRGGLVLADEMSKSKGLQSKI